MTAIAFVNGTVFTADATNTVATAVLARDGAIRAVGTDAEIRDAATQYPLSTMAVVDRNILRLAIWELLTDDSAPVAAVVNEAVELAHRYGGDSSPRFINGVLRTVSERIRSARAATGAVPAEFHPEPTTQEN